MHRLLQVSFSAAGFRLDNVADLARITRPVGTSNHKYGRDVVVGIAEEREVRYPLADIEALIGCGPEFDPTVLPVPREAADGALSGKFELVEKHCAFVRELRTSPAEVSEPQWYGAATIAAHCEDGEERFHGLSRLDGKRYNFGETAKKLGHARHVRPRTCASIESDLGCEACKRCPFRGADFKSPYALAFGDPELLGLQEDYVLVGETYQCVTRNEPPLPRRAFENHFAHRVEHPHAAFIADKRSPKARVVEYLPGEPRLMLEVEGVPVLNAWRDGGAISAAGDCNTILSHINYLLPRSDEQQWLLDYLAHLIQRPSTKIQSGITLIGGQGVGKSFLGKLLDRLFGSANVFVDDAGVHASDYKLQLGNRQVLIIEEMATAQKWEISNSIKPWFTDEKVRAHEKFVPIRDVRTPRGIFVFSNHAVPAVLEMDDRRNAVFRIDAAPETKAYYDRLWSEGLNEVGQFKAWLQARDISAWSPNARPPMTAAKREMITSSRTPAAMEIEELVRDMGKELITAREILAKLQHPLYPSRFNLKQVIQAMQELGFRKLEKTKLSTGNTVDLWAIANVQQWLAADHATRKSHTKVE